MDILSKPLEFYEWTLTIADPRVADWPFISSPIPTLIIVSIYLAVINYFGPNFMEKRPAYDFGLFLPAYNFALVGLNYYILHLVVTGSYAAGYSYICTPLTKDFDDLNERKVALGVWLYYISKLIELFDTLLFLLRKRYRQISFLHVYHHSTMPLLWWIGCKWIPGGQSFVGVILNSFVHVVMYSYYALAAFGPSIRKYLWWKKYITMLQLAQFCVVIIHTANSLYIECPSPRWMHWALIGYATSFIFLFSNFYIQTYLEKRPSSSKNVVTEETEVGDGDNPPKRAMSAVRRRKM